MYILLQKKKKRETSTLAVLRCRMYSRVFSSGDVTFNLRLQLKTTVRLEHRHPPSIVYDCTNQQRAQPNPNLYLFDLENIELPVINIH